MKQYHGADHSRSFFEGWYFKHQAGPLAVAFIPGISLDASGKQNAFLQIITNEGAHQASFDPSAFRAEERALRIRVGNCLFTEEGIVLDVKSDGLECRGAVRYGRFTPLRTDIMGPFRRLPGMECRHGILSLYHKIWGRIVLNGKTYSFENGVGYIEKDWGSSFPQKYCWVQCNDFPSGDLFISASAAKIPFLGPSFLGCIAAVHFRGTEYRLATYTGAKVEAMAPDRLIICRGDCRLEAEVLSGSGFDLRAPLRGTMSRTIRESPACRVRFRFFQDGRLLFDRESSGAGFEYADASQ
ncbi:tocopherol cyclase family protein [Papillibacter cinnamivorans]|uniref:Tocopherol cyclase n=1 Tax=Papillibacter cinnamivorans DSM 12816 TaxID=1122930 RepID=A0A1W2CKV6_9FIRM|nr:tocopherol cyclase family protein [Papillibacter cinnamivorans]SMC85830.1 Tocopherol cyclase [Papillibacter cinnamivorans DSM 12816]